MPGILKVGMTERTPEIRLQEANSSDTWRPPSPYKIEFAKKVSNPKQKETTIHILLAQYKERINPKREFFRASTQEIKMFFELMDGDFWENEEKYKQYEDEYEKNEYDENDYDKNEDSDSKTNPLRCRDTRICFTHGQRIRHTIGNYNVWIGTYDSSKNGILCNGILYQGRSPLNQFVKSHYQTERTDRVSNANAWSECECEINGQWVSTFNL
jgi:hypothetical protein